LSRGENFKTALRQYPLDLFMGCFVVLVFVFFPLRCPAGFPGIGFAENAARIPIRAPIAAAASFAGAMARRF